MNILAINETGLSPAWMNIHNVYLQYATDLGFPGLILFLLIFLGASRVRTSSSNAPPPARSRATCSIPRHRDQDDLCPSPVRSLPRAPARALRTCGQPSRDQPAAMN